MTHLEALRAYLAHCRAEDARLQADWDHANRACQDFESTHHIDCGQECFQCASAGPPLLSEEVAEQHRVLAGKVAVAWDVMMEQRHVTVRAEKALREAERAEERV